MGTPSLPKDFKEFLKLLNENRVEYLVVGGYAVSFYGYVRATADLDVWIALDVQNARKAVAALRKFGFDVEELTVDLLLTPDRIIRMGIPPFRIEMLTSISGVQFLECYPKRTVHELDGIEVSLIGLEDLKVNKRASGRLKDLSDLEHLP